MKMYHDLSFSIFFGDSQESCDPALYRIYTSKQLSLQFPFTTIKNYLNGDLFFLHQKHGTKGMIIDDVQMRESFVSFSYEGDYLITNQSQVALGVITADCLPIIFYDLHNKICAIAHAGWRGSVDGIAHKVLDSMHARYATNPAQVTVFFGPSACVCCYRVDEKFLEPLRQLSIFDQVVKKKDYQYFFDVPLYNELMLIQLGINKKSINRDYNFCTLCIDGYCSYRRQPAQLYRNITVISLNA